MSDKLNLPDSAKEIAEKLENSAMSNGRLAGENSLIWMTYLTPADIRELLTGLSDARDEIEQQNKIIGNLIDAVAKTTADANREIDTLKAELKERKG